MKPQLTAQQFEEALPRLGRLSGDSVAIARQVLVEGKTQSEVARENDITRQRVYGMVTRVNAALNDIPKGWVRFESYMPPELVKKVEALIEKAKKEITKNPSKEGF